MFDFPNIDGLVINQLQPFQQISSNKTLPPLLVIRSEILDCENLVFDAICQHTVNGDLKTFAFFDEYYVLLSEFGLEIVSHLQAQL